MNTQLILKKRNLLTEWSGLSTITSPTGWSQADNGNVTHTPGVSENIDQSILLPSLTYRITVRVTGRTAGTLTVSTGVGLGNDSGAPIALDGLYQYDLVAGGSSSSNALIFRLHADSAFDGTVNWLEIVEYPGTFNIDLKDNSQFPITYNIADIREPSKRNTSFSKTITLPGTDNNNQVLGQIYEISQDGTFNPNKFTGAVVLQDGLEVFSSVMQVIGINRIQNGINNYNDIEYQINLMGRLTDIFLELKDTKLTDLDFSEYDHIYNRDNQEDSWVGAIQKNGSNYNNYTFGPSITFSSISPNGTGSQTRVELNCTGAHGLSVGDQLLLSGTPLASSNPQLLGYNVVHEITGVNDVVIESSWNDLLISTANGTVQTHVPTGEGYVYPMIDYGSVGMDIKIWTVQDFRPAIYLKEYIDAMFALTQRSYTSTFMNSSYFKRLIIPSNSEKMTLSTDQINDRLFRAGMNSSQNGTYEMLSTLSYNPTNTGSQWSFLEFDNDTTYGNYDGNNPIVPQTNYDTTLFEYTVPQNGYYTFNFAGLITNQIQEAYFYTLSTGTFANGETITITSGTGAGSTAVINAMGTNPITGSNFDGVYLFLTNYVNVGTGWTTTPQTFTNGTGGTGIISTSTDVEIVGTGQERKFTLYITKNGFAFSTTVIQNSWITNSPLTVTAAISDPCQAGDIIKCVGEWEGRTNTGIYQAKVPVEYALNDGHFWATIENPIVVEGNNISLNQVVPTNVYNRDLLSSVINAFNLYVVQDPTNNRNLIIEPRDDFYTNTTVDWTSKLDISKQIILEPMAELQGRTYLYTYKSDKDILNKTYEDIYNKRRYGDQLIEVDNDFVKNSKTVELLFSPSILAGANDFYYNRDLTITQIKKDFISTPSFVQSNIRLLWFSLIGNSTPWIHAFNVHNIISPGLLVVGQLYTINTFFNGDDFLNVGAAYNGSGVSFIATNTTPTVWTYSTVSSDSGIERDFHPYAGHLDKPKTPVVDLNFGYPNRLWYNYNSYTSNNLFNKFHKNYIDEITNKDSKLVTGYFKLGSSDIETLDFSSLYFVDGHILRLNKVIDYDPISVGVTKCEFITVKSGTNWEGSSDIGIFPGGVIHLFGSAVNLPIINDGSMTYNTVPGNTRDDGNGAVINGTGNIIRGGAKSISVLGDNNDIGQNTKNILIQGNNNTVYGGLSNITIINTSGVTVTESNVSWINGVFYPPNTGFPPVVTSNSITTTDATLTNVTTITMADDQVASVDAIVSCMGTVAANNAASSKMFASFYKRAGVITQIGSTTKNLNAKVGQDTFISTDGTNIFIQVSGVAATTLVWNVTSETNTTQA
jgi:hypothetical protein